MSRNAQVQAAELVTGDVVVLGTGRTWTVETVTSYRDRDGKSQVAATGHSPGGQQFSLLKRAHYPVTVRTS